MAVPQPGVAVADGYSGGGGTGGHIQAVQIGVMEAVVVAHSTLEPIKTILPG